MAKQIIALPEIGEVEFSKNQRAKSLKINISGSKIKVTYPRYVSLLMAKSYVISKKSWIIKNRKNSHIFHSGDLIGKTHKLVIESSNRSSITSKIHDNTLIVKIPNNLDPYSAEIQHKIKSKIEKVLKTESENLITTRLKDISYEQNINYRSINYKKLSRRWGSCDSKKNIILNLYLVQFPWNIIDYVIAHELAHTQELNHSPKFWKVVESIYPDYKTAKQAIKDHSPEAYGI